MKQMPDLATFSRPPGFSPLGKRTARIQFSAPELIEKCLHEEAQIRGIRPERLAEALLIARYTQVSSLIDGHEVIVHQVPASGKEIK